MEQVDIINAALERGEKVEIVPTKDGYKIFRVKRKEIRPADK